MNEDLRALLHDISELLSRNGLAPVDLYALGGTATGLVVERPVGTNDLDAIRDHLEPEVQEHLRGFGAQSGRDFYLELVNAGTACLAIGFRRRASRHALSTPAVRLHVLSPFDLIVSKLRRWSPRDRADIECLCDEYPECEEYLRALTKADFYEDDIWEEVMSERRDLVVLYLRGELRGL